MRIGALLAIALYLHYFRHHTPLLLPFAHLSFLSIAIHLADEVIGIIVPA
jgi:hypothetical protein